MLQISYVFLLIFVSNVNVSRMNALQPYNVLQASNTPDHLLVKRSTCSAFQAGNVTHKSYPGNSADSTNGFVSDVETFVRLPGYMTGHLVYIANPLQSVTVLEPGGILGGCAKSVRSTVTTSARSQHCEVAVNAGFFRQSGSCLGNLVINGKIIIDDGGIKNAHFGIKKNGDLFFGYLTEADLIADNFETLVGGVIWLLRDGKSYVNVSVQSECRDTEETGTLERFANVVSARTAVGHDRDGRLVLVHVNGKTDTAGVDLWELADILAEYGLVNAINLDGGGSSTMVINGTVVNIPSDHCENNPAFRCPRAVSTILCVKRPTTPTVKSSNPTVQPSNPTVQPSNPTVQPSKPTVEAANPSVEHSVTSHQYYTKSVLVSIVLIVMFILLTIPTFVSCLVYRHRWISMRRMLLLDESSTNGSASAAYHAPATKKVTFSARNKYSGQEYLLANENETSDKEDLTDSDKTDEIEQILFLKS